MDLLRFLLRLPFTLLKGVFRLLALIFRLFGRIFRPIIGNVNWRAPAWWQFSSRKLKSGIERTEAGINKYPKAIALTILLLLGIAAAAFYGYHWWLNRPQPMEPAPLLYKETRVKISNPSTINYYVNKANKQNITG